MSPGVVELPANNEEEFAIEVIHPVRTKISELADNRVSIDSSSKAKHTFTFSESAVTGSEVSLYGATSPTSWLSLNTSQPLPITGVTGYSRMRSEQLLFGSYIDERALNGGIWAGDGYLDEKQALQYPSSFGSTDYSHPRVMEAVTSAMQRLNHVRHQEQISRPIRFEPHNQLHKPSTGILKIFEASVNDELHLRRPITRDWLRVSTWWLLKVGYSHHSICSLLTTNTRLVQLSQTATGIPTLAPGVA
jgi:hypothetical protein